MFSNLPSEGMLINTKKCMLAMKYTLFIHLKYISRNILQRVVVHVRL